MFNAKTKEIATKTSYGTVGTDYAIITWSAGDKIRIYSPEEGVVSSSTSSSGFYYADYSIEGATTEGTHSKATNLKPESEHGLMWEEGSSSAMFYGIYPNTVGISPSGGDMRAAISIPASQDGSVSAMPMVAKTSAPVSKGGNVSLEFAAAFTTFEFTIKADTGSGTLTLNSVTLSTTDEDLSLAGSGFLDIDNGNFTYGSSLSNAVTVSFSDPKPEITEEDSSAYTFRLFTLPVNLTKLVLTVNYTKGGTPAQKKLALKYSNGTELSIPAGKYTRIYGLAVKETGFRFFLSPGMVDELGEKNHIISY